MEIVRTDSCCSSSSSSSELRASLASSGPHDIPPPPPLPSWSVPAPAPSPSIPTPPPLPSWSVRRPSSPIQPTHDVAQEEPAEPEETAFCPICFDDVPKSECITLGCCDSTYCLPCLQRFVFEFIQAGKVEDVCCPNPDCSSGSWDQKEVANVFEKTAAVFSLEGGRTLSGEEVLNRFVRFKMLCDAQADQLQTKGKTHLCRKEDCDGVLVTSDKGDSGSVDCRLCSLTHCGECFLVHDGENESCERTKKRVAKEDYKKTDKYKRRKEFTIAARAFLPTVATRLTLAIKPNVKRCPTCHKFIEKYYGCKHMYCSSCKTSFCWICTTPSGGGRKHCRVAKAIWPASLLAAICFSAVYVPVVFLPWLTVYGVEAGILKTPKRERKHIAVWDQFYFVNEMLASFPY